MVFLKPPTTAHLRTYQPTTDPIIWKNFWWKNARSYYKYNIENVSNCFLINVGMCYWNGKNKSE